MQIEARDMHLEGIYSDDKRHFGSEVKRGSGSVCGRKQCAKFEKDGLHDKALQSHDDVLIIAGARMQCFQALRIGAQFFHRASFH